ncbi:MAG: glycerophosphodiester phosphodiesterase family protein [Hellea sp.]|nr:glycerophosphodiester phosphodiesterase family protein [Hellea sp.]
MKLIIPLAFLLALSSCKQSAPEPDKPEQSPRQHSVDTTLPLRSHLQCLPKEAAIVAAHRGTSKKEDLPENAASSLRALIAAGFIMAEVDVAGLKDGTHILFHDGVWEEKTTGSGVVAATKWSEAEKFLLKDTDGDLSADRLVTLQDALGLAKGTMYLEIDFKSSAKYGKVISLIRSSGMTDRVILIAYNDRQAKRLAQLAPEMILSVGANSIADIKNLEDNGVKRENMAIWLGKGPYDADFIAYLDEHKMPVLAWPDEGARRQSLGPATVAVTDYAMQKTPIEGINENGWAAYKACLEQ